MHEVVDVIASWSDRAALLSTDGMEPRSKVHLAAVKQELTCDELLGLGLWIDGAPYNWDRTESLEIVSLNFPGLTGKDSAIRIPLCAIPKHFVATDETFHDIMEIIVWSLRHLAVGTHPARRHDGEDWHAGDSSRRKNAEKPLRIQAALIEVRGDWLMMKEVFNLPAWNEKAGCCWLCTATPESKRNAGLDAPWRSARLNHWQLLERLARNGKAMSPLLSAPGIRSHCFKVDWLHAVDQGTGADFLGNMFRILLGKMPGRAAKDRLKELWREVLRYYEEHQVESRLQTLTFGMIKKKNCPPKLRCKAAEARALIPFAHLAAQKFLSDSDVTEEAAKSMANHLNVMYHALSADTIFRDDTMREHCRKFCVLYCTLEDQHKDHPQKPWRVKPKMHLMQELCEMTDGIDPVRSWTYRDEDFGGSMAHTGQRKGGKYTAIAVSRQVLTRFVTRYDVPSIR